MSKYVGLIAMSLLLVCCVDPAQSSIYRIGTSVDSHDHVPLILESNADEFVYMSEYDSSSLCLAHDDKFRVACPGGIITVDGRNTSLEVAQLSCHNATHFDLDGTSYVAPFRQIRCNRLPKSKERETTTTCGNGTIAKIGFAVSNSSFVPSIGKICLDAHQTFWTHHKVLPNLPDSTNCSMPFLISDDKRNVNRMGPWQSTVIEGFINATINTTVTKTWELDKISLVPCEDMFYPAQQESVYYVVNTVVMYRDVENGNWGLVEDIVRTLARNQTTTLDVWTGTYIARKDSISESDAFGSLSPRIVFKMIVDERHERGIVFVTFNDPTVTAIADEEKICTAYTRCSSLYPQFDDVVRGYTHCCTLADFASVAVELGMPSFANYQPIV